jgi:effector-binding domain-containing protein
MPILPILIGGSRGRIWPVKYDVVVEIARPELVAAVRATIPLSDIPRTWKPALDRVWAFLKARRDLNAGHNLFLYHHPADRHEAMNIDFGVQVARPFEPEGDVRCIETPAGEVAKTVHVGPYDRLGDAHHAIHNWCAANNRKIAQASWETYGDWIEDPARLETTIKYLLA